MLIKRKKFKKKQILLKLYFLKNELKVLIKKSLFKNHFNNYIFRLSFTIHIFLKKKNHFFSLNKLICPFTLSKKIPSKSFFFSRFFLNNQFQSLNINNSYV